MMKNAIIAAALALFCASVAFAEKTTAVVLQKDMALWSEKSEGMMEYAKLSLDPGETVEAYISGTDGNNKPVAVTKRSAWTNAKEGQTLLFTKVSYKNKDYYAISNRIALGLQPALVLENAGTYVSKNFADIRKKGVAEGTVIAVDLANKGGSGLYTLIKMAYYDESAYVLREGYILSRKISTTKDDISAYKLLKQAENEPDEARRNAILNSIAQLKTSEKINELLAAQSEQAAKLKDLTPWGVVEIDEFAIIDAQGKNRDFSVPFKDAVFEYVNIRSLPGLDGEIVTKHSLIRCSFSKRTAEKVTIDGVEDYWYFIEEVPVHEYDANGELINTEYKNGWVFGAYSRPWNQEWDPW